jgi:hypothetical protein
MRRPITALRQAVLEESLPIFSTNPLSPSLQFYLMPSFSFSRSAVFGFSLVAALIAVALVLFPSSLSVSNLVSGSLSSSSSSIPSIRSDATNLANPDTTMASRAAPLVFPALSRHTATVIFVHGLGDSGHGWADAVQLWQRKHRLDEVKFILPNARTMPITVVSLACRDYLRLFALRTPDVGRDIFSNNLLTICRV